MDVSTFLRSHVPEITATTLLVTYATTRNKLTPAGVLAGILVAFIHMLHPWPAFFWLLMVFFLCGTGVTKIGHKDKSLLTQSSTGSPGGEGPRSSVQVFCNSGVACILIAAHAYLLRQQNTPFISSLLPVSPGPHFPLAEKLLPIGIVAQYAAVASDTFSSELGILARNDPFMITAPWRRVPRGTNGGVTVDGLLYGLLGSAMLTGVAAMALYALPPHVVMSTTTGGLLVAAGLAGSIIDSILGALGQVTVTDQRTGRVVEGPGGQRVLVEKGGSRAKTGRDVLTNNGVNFLMATLAAILAMGVAAEMELTI